MHISHIQSNIKGRTIDFELYPATLVIGPNFSGKSALLTALRLGMAGYLPPPIGKAGQSIYSALAPTPGEPGTLEIRLHVTHRTEGIRFQEGQFISTWTKTASGSVRGDVGTPAGLRLPGVLVDPRVFFGMTSTQRTRAIFEACGTEGIGLPSIEAAINEACPGYPPGKAVVVSAIQAAYPTVGIDGAIPKGIEVAKAIISVAKDAMRTQSAVVTTLNTADEIPQDVGPEIIEKERLLSDAQHRMAKARAEQQAYDRSVAAFKALPSPEVIQKAINDALEFLPGEAPPVVVPLWPGTDEQISLEEWEQRVTVLMRTNQSISENNTRLRRAIADRSAKKPCSQCGSSEWPNLAHLEEELAKVPQPVDLTWHQGALLLWKEAEQNRSNNNENRARRLSEIEVLKQRLESVNAARWGGMPPQPDPEAVTKAAMAVASLETALGLLREQQGKLIAYQNRQAERDAAQRAFARALEEEGAATRIVNALTQFQQRHIEGAFNEVLAASQEFTAGILNSPLEYANGELGRRVSEFDRKLGSKSPIGSWISHEAFSGTEEALAYAAFSVAISKRAKFRIVFLDELGRMEGEIRDRVLIRMVDLVKSGTIDQFIGVHASGVELRTLNLSLAG